MVATSILKSCELFQGLADTQLAKVAALSREETYKAGSTMFKEGGRAEKLYILVEGKVILEMRVQLAPHRPATHATLDVITKGEPFNWSSLVEPHIVTLSAVCIDDVKVISIDGSQLLKLMEEDCGMGYQVMKRIAALISSRLRHTRQTLISERGLALL